MTWEELAPYGIGTPDADGIYPDYRIPRHLKPAAPVVKASGRAVWWADIVRHWDLVLLDLSERHRLNLFDPAVLALPWPGVRGLILGLLSEPSRLSRALSEEDASGQHAARR